MSKFFLNLFENVPSANHLLDMEPKELAGHVLLSLENDDLIKPDELIGHRSMSNALYQKRDLSDVYPKELHDNVIFALMEAWQYLKSACFVATRPSSLSTIHSIYSSPVYFVTRLGKSIETFEDYKRLI